MDKYIISVYGAGKLDKVKTNLKNGTEESKRRFIKKYPYANLNKFEFQVDLDKDGDIDGYTVYYKIDDVSSYDITSGTFLNNKEWMKHLYWQEPWGIKGTVQPFIKNTTMNRKANYLKIYVTSDQFFEITLPEFDISNGSSNDYKVNTYLAALFAAYITTYSCGISTEHFEYNSKTPKIVTSIARYHLYYHMKRFIRQPNKMSRFVTHGIKTIITNNKRRFAFHNFHRFRMASGSSSSQRLRESHTSRYMNLPDRVTGAASPNGSNMEASLLRTVLLVSSFDSTSGNTTAN
jgi:hypothetical protein